MDTTAKAQAHALLDDFDDEQTAVALRSLQDIAASREAADDRVFTRDSPLWRIAGIAKGGASDISERHDAYLADAYGDLHRD